MGGAAAMVTVVAATVTAVAAERVVTAAGRAEEAAAVREAERGPWMPEICSNPHWLGESFGASGPRRFPSTGNTWRRIKHWRGDFSLLQQKNPPLKKPSRFCGA